MDIQKAAKLLGRKLLVKVPGVHGISLKERREDILPRNNPDVPHMSIYVHIDSDEVDVLHKIPAKYYGYKIHFAISKPPTFASESG